MFQLAYITSTARVALSATLWVALSSSLASGQEAPEEPEEPESEVSPQIWVDYNPSVMLSPKLNLYGDAGFRTELESGGWWRLLLRANAMYYLSNSLPTRARSESPRPRRG